MSSNRTTTCPHEIRLRRIAVTLDGVLASRWLRVLERMEIPARMLRPGLGTLRVRLECLRRLAQGRPGEGCCVEAIDRDAIDRDRIDRGEMGAVDRDRIDRGEMGAVEMEPDGVEPAQYR
jgi:hypothetical protein